MKKLLPILLCFCSLIAYAQPGTPFKSFNTKNGSPENNSFTMSGTPNLLELNDGGILVLNRSGSLDGFPHKGIVKIWPNGISDDNFSFFQNEFLMANDACQDSTDIIYVGCERDGGTSDYLFILNPDGSIISSFGPTNGPNDQVTATKIVGDRLYIAGDFSMYNGATQHKICRLNLDGTIDATFQSRFTNSDKVFGMMQMQNGKLLVYGDFSTYDGNIAKGFVLLNDDGSFYLGPTANIRAGLNAFELNDGRVLSAASVHNGPVQVLSIIDTNLTFTNFVTLPSSGDDLDEFTYNRKMPITQNDAGQIYVANLRYQDESASPTIVVKYNIFKFSESGVLDSSFHSPIEQYQNVFTPGLLSVNDTSLYFSTNLNSGSFMATDFPIHQLDTNGLLDETLVASTEAIFTPTEIGDLMVLDADNVLVGGIFSTYSGSAAASVAKVNRATGMNDPSLTITGSNAQLVHRLKKDASGSYFAVGDQYLMNGSSNRGIAKFLPSGVPDPSFTSPLLANQVNVVKAIDVLSDGRILIGGNIRQGSQSKRLQLLSANGTMDVNFNTLTSGPNLDVLDIEAVDAQNIYVAGNFTDYNGTARRGLIKVDDEGALNTTFAPVFNGNVREIVLDHSGRILCIGDFTIVNGATVNGFCRLNADGTLDNTLNLGTGFNDKVRDVLIQPDSMLVIVGDFTTYNNQDLRYMVRLDELGNVDPFFEVNLIQRPVYEIELLPDTTAVIRGIFQRVGPDYYNYLAKIELKCVAPDQPTILGSDNYVCEGQFFNAEVQGDLNGSLNWVWYKGSTTNPPFSTDDRIRDSITQTTKYYVQAAAGCAPASDFDSVEVELRYPTAEVVYAEACSSYTWSANGAVLTSSGTYEAHIMNVQGCDSMVTLHLTFPELDTLNITVSQDSNLVQTNLIWPEYKWYNCNNNALLQVTNVPFWEPDRSYNIRLQIESADGVCRRNADCFDFVQPVQPDVTGMDENDWSNFVLYPNPAHRIIQVASETQWAQYEIRSQEGRLLKAGSNENGPISIEALAPGMYYLMIRNNQSQAMKAFVVE